MRLHSELIIIIICSIGVTSHVYAMNDSAGQVPAKKRCVRRYVIGDAEIKKQKQLNAALLKAAKEGCLADAEKALEQGAFVNAQDKEGNTPLHECGFLEVVRLLLKHKADPTIENHRDETVLHCANISEAVVSMLIKALLERDACDYTEEQRRARVSQFMNSNLSSAGRTRFCTLPLHVHAASGNGGAVAALVLAGADVNQHDRFGFAPLHRTGCLRTVEQLIALKADVNLKSKHEGATPLHYAYSDEKVRLLVAHNADVNAINNFGHSALHHAANAEVALELLESGALVSVQDRSGKTPLRRAIDRVDMDVIGVLLQMRWGADLERADNEGETVIQRALRLKIMTHDGDLSLILVHTLLAAGARMPVDAQARLADKKS